MSVKKTKADWASEAAVANMRAHEAEVKADKLMKELDSSWRKIGNAVWFSVLGFAMGVATNLIIHGVFK